MIVVLPTLERRTAVELKPGMRLRSVTCTTEMIVVRTTAGDVDLRCGGHPMVAMVAAAGEVTGQTLDPAFSAATLVGKRYASGDLEVLCTKPGAGSPSLGTEPLEIKGAKALPSSD